MTDGALRVGQEITMRVEISRGAFVKRDEHGHVEFVSPWPSPANYGAAIGLGTSGDGEDVDVLFMGLRHPRGAVLTGRLLAAVDFLDRGHADPKLIVGTQPLSQTQRLMLERFFLRYARMKRIMRRTRHTAYRGWLA